MFVLSCWMYVFTVGVATVTRIFLRPHPTLGYWPISTLAFSSGSTWNSTADSLICSVDGTKPLSGSYWDLVLLQQHCWIRVPRPPYCRPVMLQQSCCSKYCPLNVPVWKQKPFVPVQGKVNFWGGGCCIKGDCGCRNEMEEERFDFCFKYYIVSRPGGGGERVPQNLTILGDRGAWERLFFPNPGFPTEDFLLHYLT